MARRIVLVGFGNVGRAFARLLVERRRDLRRSYGLEASVVAILTARHGGVLRSSGIDLPRAVRRAEAGESLTGLGRPISLSTVEFVRAVRADVVVELTPLQIGPRQTALDRIVASLSAGKHVITANKGPLVYHVRRLQSLAERSNAGFRYEGTVMDGAPVFNLFQETLRGARLESFEGILNSTSNFVLTQIEAGQTYEAAVEDARHLGILEADAAMDLDGWDATVKACLLTNVLMGGRVRPEAVPRQGVVSLSPETIRSARASGTPLKQIARGWREGRGVRARVSVEPLTLDHPLAQVGGTSNALLARTDMLPEILLSEHSPGVRQTAFAVYSDLLAIHEGRLHPWGTLISRGPMSRSHARRRGRDL